MQCQSQRSQHQNKDRAIKQLKSKLYELELNKKEMEVQKLEDSKTDIGWGNQIRSYVLDQSRIKDIRTKTKNKYSAVLDSKINNFIKAYLKMDTKELNKIQKDREEKLKKLRDQGFNFPNDFDKTHNLGEIAEKFSDSSN